MDVPEAIEQITEMDGVHSTHLNFPETAEDLAAKTRPIAEKWAPVADRLYDEMPDKENTRFGILTRLMFWGNDKVARW